MKSPHSFFHRLTVAIRTRFHSLSKREKNVFGVLAIIVVLGMIGFINYESDRFSVHIPTYGGTISEGILGTPRFINPVLANSDIDQDLTELVYSGLVRKVFNKESGTTIIPDLAESYSVSDDGKTYTFVLKNDAVFHDRKPITADDVVFTIQTIQDNRFQSPLVENWIGITAEAIDSKTVKITLPRAFSGFLETATIGILPKHIWGILKTDEFLASNYNIVPIGSGPYKVNSITRDANGIATTYSLSAFNKFTLGKPYIKKINISLYPNEQSLLTAYEQKDVDLLANIRPYEMSPDNTPFTATTELPRMFGLFMNTDKNEILKDVALRSIINNAIDKTEITQSVFQGYAHTIDHPLPKLEQILADKKSNDSINSRLETLGWKMNTETKTREKNGVPFAFTISTADTAELKYTAQIIQKQLKAVGISTEIQIFQLNDLENSVIKKRSFDSLLFGQFIRNDADLYAFWHSSQKDASGLNITGYTNKNLDSLIEKLLETSDETSRSGLLKSLAQELSHAPIIWLYQPDFVYALHRPVYGINLTNLISKHDRFASIYTWYLQTDTVWKMFNK